MVPSDEPLAILYFKGDSHTNSNATYAAKCYFNALPKLVFLKNI